MPRARARRIAAGHPAIAVAIAGDLVVQRVVAPFAPLRADGFDSGGAEAWPSVAP